MIEWTAHWSCIAGIQRTLTGPVTTDPVLCTTLVAALLRESNPTKARSNTETLDQSSCFCHA